MEQREERKKALVFRAALVLIILCLLMTCAVCGIITRYEITGGSNPKPDVEFDVGDDDLTNKDDEKEPEDQPKPGDDKPDTPDGPAPGDNDKPGTKPDDQGEKPGKPGGTDQPKPGDDKPDDGGEGKEDPNPENPENPDDGEDDDKIIIIIPPSGPQEPPKMTTTFDLFDTIAEADCFSEEKHVSSGVIAPGTGGTFNIGITNDSSYTIKYEVELKETNEDDVFIQYSINGGRVWFDDLETINDVLAEKNYKLRRKDSGTLTVYWRWVYEADGDSTAHDGQSDIADTALGIAAQGKAPEVTITADLTAWYA